MSEAGLPDDPPAEGSSGVDESPSEKRKLTGLPLLVAALAVVLFVQALFVLSYIGALHDPKPHSVAFGVVGASPLPIAVSKQFSLDITRYSSESDANAAIDERTIDGAFIAGPNGSRLIVVPAAGAVGASALTNAFGVAGAATGQRIDVVQAHPLPTGDRGGAVSFLVVMALIVGGYLASTIGMVFGGRPTRKGRLASLALVSVVGALLTDVLAGPVLGALPTSKFLVLWAVFTLVMMAVAFSAAALQTVLGAGGTLVVVIVFIIFGAPASGGAVPNAYLPTLWRTLGPYLPAGAGTETVRNILYFDGNATTGSLIVLAAYLVAGAVAVVVLRRRESPSPAEAEVATASAATIVV